jgi:GNAT superfamily N-acetyltransferase
VIRQAQPADLAAVQRIVEAAYAPYVSVMGRRPAPMDEDHAAQISAGQVWIAPPDGVVVLVETEDSLLIDNVAVHPSAQGRGIGRALLAFAETEAQRRGLKRLRLYTNAAMTRNVALYARCGWHETHRATQSGFDRVFMEKAA